MTCLCSVIRSLKCHQMLRKPHSQISSPAEAAQSFLSAPVLAKTKRSNWPFAGVSPTLKVSAEGEADVAGQGL